MITLKSPIKDLPYLGKSAAPKLRRLNIKTVSDLLWYLPTRYDDLTEVKKISQLVEDERATIRGKVTLLQSRRSWKQRLTVTELQIEDDSGSLQAIWFRQPYVSKVLKIGDEIFLTGKVKNSLLNLQMANPSYEKVKTEQLHMARIAPRYALTKGLSDKQLRFLIKEALPLTDQLTDSIPSEIIAAEKYPPLAQAIQQIHFPDDWTTLGWAERRIKFEELFWLQLKVLQSKHDYQDTPAPTIGITDDQKQAWLKTLPFILTNDQLTSAEEILADLRQEVPMNRLVEGDVGSGKTVVAALAAYATIINGYQVALMAATEILANQHFINFLKLLPDAPIALLTSKQHYLSHNGEYGEVSKQTITKNLKQGNIQLIIGTHSLIQENISWPKLGLAVIDEQHRFGVAQRQSLRKKAAGDLAPHLLSLTATPIPRTLSLTLYGDLDISIIKEKPGHRKSTITKLVEDKNRSKAYDWIYQRIKKGEQLFVICPMVTDSETLRPRGDRPVGEAIKSVLAEHKKLQTEIYPQLDIQFLHGKMLSADKERVINAFRSKKFPILVASSVVEVGIDIPGATMMIIEGAERFGLSQLHQFRGRIGRNDLASFCFLFTSDPDHHNKERLQALTKYTDGFKLSEIDLQLRGAGDVFGTQQSGLVDLKVAKLSDIGLIKKARDWAEKVLSQEPFLSDQNLQKKIRSLYSETHWE